MTYKFWTRNTHSAKLTPGQVAEIRQLYQSGTMTQGALAKKYEMSVVQIGRIVRGESWQGVRQIVPSQEGMDSTLQRLLKVQEETSRDRMAEAIKEAKEKERRGDTMLEELKINDKA